MLLKPVYNTYISETIIGIRYPMAKYFKVLVTNFFAPNTVAENIFLAIILVHIIDERPPILIKKDYVRQEGSWS